VANCADDLTSLDLSLLPPASISSASSSTTISLYPFLLLSQSHGLNLEDPATLPRLLRPIDSKDVVKTNEELVGTELEVGEGGVWSGGCVESQEGDDEIILRVSGSLDDGRRRRLRWWN
jgi:hypothetical protein